MKRYRNLYQQIYNIENIKLAHENARKGKSHYREVIEVNNNPIYYFNEIHNLLKDKTFKNSFYNIFTKIDNDKEREIYKLPYFPDGIIHHAIMQIIEPIWKKSLINDTYSSIKGRGIHKGVKRIKDALKDIDNTQYCLKLDIKKYYPSIDHDILKNIIRNKLKDNDLLWLLDNIIDSAPGIPIGNYLSQYFANLYLSNFDHWIKEVLKIKYYFRYCDDMVILNNSKENLHIYFLKITEYLKDLKLEIKSNYRIFPTSTGIDFLGYIFFPKYTLIRKKIKNNCINKLKDKNIDKVYRSFMSYYGWFIHCNSYNLRSGLISNKLKMDIYKYCKDNKLHNPIRRFLS
jgi:hypothetical protein